tara:strand:- start:3347 stop:3667 length:321 start_codon:yes stop_codon:yes gene_type:complete
MTYEIYQNPAATQENDIDIVNNALALARVLRDDVVVKGATAWGYTAFVEGVATTIRNASQLMNHVGASHEVWQFGAYLAGTHRDDLDGLICDYLSSAQARVEGDLQ